MKKQLTYCDRIMAAILGEPNDELPFAPRIDLWYKANKRRGTLPSKYRNSELIDIIEDLDIGYNATVPDYRALKTREDESDRALGIYQCEEIFYKVRFDLEKTVTIDGDELVTHFRTPHGTIRTKSFLTPEMENDGISLSHVSEKAFKTPGDYEALKYIFEHVEVVPYYEGVERMREQVRDRGPLIAFSSSVASPIHYIQKHLMRYEQFFYEYYDHPESIRDLAQSIESFEEKTFAVTAASPVKIIRIGANYDSMLQPPPFFREHLLPALRSYSERLHNLGKLLLTHSDGENEGLLEMYLESGLDIADSICPAPMTKTTMEEVRRIFGESITIWGGIPSVLMLNSSCSDSDFELYLEELFEILGDGRSFIMAIADTTPPDADFDRICTLARRTKEFGSIPGRCGETNI